MAYFHIYPLFIVAGSGLAVVVVLAQGCFSFTGVTGSFHLPVDIADVGVAHDDAISYSRVGIIVRFVMGGANSIGGLPLCSYTSSYAQSSAGNACCTGEVHTAMSGYPCTMRPLHA